MGAMLSSSPTCAVKAGSGGRKRQKILLGRRSDALACAIIICGFGGIQLPYQGGVFPGQYGAARIFYYNSIMRRYLKIPQISAVMGPCIAGGAYLPALSDIIVMVEGTSFMGLGGANLVKGATGQTIDNETLGGARAHNELSGVAHYRVPDDEACVAKIREFVSELSVKPASAVSITESVEAARPAVELYDLIPEDHRQPYNMRAVLECLLGRRALRRFSVDYARR